MFYFSVADLCVTLMDLFLSTFRQGVAWLGYPEPCQNTQDRNKGHSMKFQPPWVQTGCPRAPNRWVWSHMLHDGDHGLYELMGSLQQDLMASVLVCDHVSVPSTNLLTAYLKQSRRLCNIFSLSFQSRERGEHTLATPLSCLIYFIRGSNPVLYIFPQYSPNLHSVISSTNLLRSCFQLWAGQVVLHNQMGYLEDFSSVMGRLRLTRTSQSI